MPFSRRALLSTVPALALADVPSHRWDGHDFGPGPAVTDRLNQGPFGIEQDGGKYTIALPLGVCTGNGLLAQGAASGYSIGRGAALKEQAC